MQLQGPVKSSLAVSGSLRQPEEVRNDRKPFFAFYSLRSIQPIITLYQKKKKQKSSAKVSPLLPPIELIKTRLCCHRYMDQLWEGSPVQQEPRHVVLDVHKAREQRHEKFELSMKGRQCQQRHNHGHSGTILNVCNRQIKRREKS